MKYPKYLVRPSDYTIFYHRTFNNEDGYYSIRVGSSYHKYENLINLGFYSCEEHELDEMNEKNKLYNKWLTWFNRSDGHGGIKGGTYDEYLKIIENGKN